MKGVIGEMRNTLYEGYAGPYMSRQVQRQRVANVIANELTEHQRRAIVGYYLEQNPDAQISEVLKLSLKNAPACLKHAGAFFRDLW